MGKKLIIKGADFSTNCIDFGPVPQEVEWSIGTISSTGVIGAENTGIHTNLLDVRDVSASIESTVLDSTAFNSTYGIIIAIAMYNSAGEFISRISSPSHGSPHTEASLSAAKLKYPTLSKVRFVIAAYATDVTNVDTALSKVDYTLEGI